MNWRERISMQRIWANSTGMDHSDVVLDRIGPLFRVTVDKEITGLHAGLALDPSWHLTYRGAEQEYTRRIIKIRTARNV